MNFSRFTPDLRALSFTLLLGLLLWSLAYQIPLFVHLPIGGDKNTHRREGDAPFIEGFNASEPSNREQIDWWKLSPGYGYRWTKGKAKLQFPGIGGERWVCTLVVSSGRPDGLATNSVWQLGSYPLPLTVPALSRSYHLLGQADAGGNLTIIMQTSPYLSPTDPRDLGFVLRDLRLAPVVSSPRLPAPAQLGWLTLALLLLYSLIRWLNFTRQQTLSFTGVLILFTTLLLATARFPLTLFTPTLALLSLVCWGLALLLKLLIPTLFPSSAKLIAIFLLAFALRLGGMLHPVAIFSDHRLNANNLFEVGLGKIYLTEGLPTDAGGGQAPYPPGIYLWLLPALLFAPPEMESRVIIVQAGVALLDSFVILLLGLILLRAGLNRRASLITATLYLLPVPILKSFSIGEYANVGGQALALPGILLLGEYLEWGELLLLCMSFLGHLGVTISLLFFFFAKLIINLATTLGSFKLNHHKSLLNLLLTYRYHAIAMGLVGFFYYSAPQFLALFAQRLTNNPGHTSFQPPSLLESINRIALSVASTINITAHAPFHPLLAAGGLLGFSFLWGYAKVQSHFRLTLAAWWLSTILALLLLLISPQGVRWQHFFYPALCLGAGPLYTILQKRGYAGWLTTLTAILLILSYGLERWIIQIADYLH